MDRLVVLVDAGYVLSQAVKILSAKKSRSRSDLKINSPVGLVNLLIAQGKLALSNDKLLRVYWYDGVRNGLSPDHKAIIDVDDVQLRTGTINGQGQQKGVDSKIVIDLIELASNQAISDAMVVTGDGDLAIGIELAQRRGIRVAVMGVEDLGVGVSHGQSPELMNVADRVVRIGQADLSPHLSYIAKSTPPPTIPAALIVPAVISSTIAATPSDSVVLNVSARASIPSPLTSAAGSTIFGATAAAASATVEPPPHQPEGGSFTTAAGSTTSVLAIVTDFLNTKTPALTSVALDAKGSIIKSVDRELLFYVYTALGKRALTDSEKTHARQALKLKLKSLP